MSLGAAFWKRGVAEWNYLNHNEKVLTDPFFYVVTHNQVKWIIVNESRTGAWCCPLVVVCMEADLNASWKLIVRKGCDLCRLND